MQLSHTIFYRSWLWIVLALVPLVTGCDRVMQIVVMVHTPLPATKVIVQEFIADAMQGQPQEITVPAQEDKSWQFGLRGPFPRSGSYQVKAKFYDARDCLLADAETPALDLESVGLLGARLELQEVLASGFRTESFCTQDKATGMLTGAVVTESKRSGGLKSPYDVCWDPACDTLFVSDTQNHRILGYSHLPPDLTQWRDYSPTFVIGRPLPTDFSDDWIEPKPASEQTLNRPHGLWCGDGILMVADTGNNRVMVYEPPPSMSCQNGAVSPVGLIGQDNYDRAAPNDGGGPLPNNLSSPMSVFWSQRRGRLLVADQLNHRVLAYPLAARPELKNINRPTATEVWGQRAMMTKDSGAGDSGLNLPRWVIENQEGQDWIAVSDTNNARVLIYDGNTPYKVGRATQASHVLGQPSFVEMKNGTGLDQLNQPLGMRLGQGLAFLADQGNHRILIFNQAALWIDSQQPGARLPAVPLTLATPILDTDSAADPSPSSVEIMQRDKRVILLVVDEKRNVIVAFDKTL